MKAHYNPDYQNILTCIFIPVQEWNSLKSEPSDIESAGAYQIPDWQKKIVLNRMEAFDAGLEDSLDLEEAMREIEKDL
ncbi:hypothetical protein [Dyadobacter sp. Leaf189]|uniref:hypothetical protein n=1 Tax=Dyadobacter sp. Leaf189 TaxID=1736295 RepID=UPI000700B1A0|nr:hypothetical protein [Dyadobacter sp. Leaf189]KQS23906.1 hypothetical protein ASG33_25165 [Dyadobacter sp. Leaf189]